MNQNEFIRDCIEWDVVNWSKAIRFWEREASLQGKRLRCLELGGRRGGLSLWLANQGHDVVCSDLENPKAIAMEVHKKYKLQGTIDYQALDATKIPYENHFDVVVFKSILGGISRDGNTAMKAKTVDQIYKALKPGGQLLFSENMIASALHRLLRRAMVRWGASWNYLKRDEVALLLQKFGQVRLEYRGFLASFGRSEKQRRILGYLDTVFFDWLMPRSMRYIVFGVAVKPFDGNK